MDKAAPFWHTCNPMKHLFSLIILAVVATSLSACHTMKGLGQDISAGGQDLTKAAEKHTN